MGGAAVSYVVNWRSSDGTDGWHAADESWAEAVWPESATTATEDSEPALEPVADGANGMHRRGLFGR